MTTRVPYSHIDKSIAAVKERVERDRLLGTVDVFTDAERTRETTERRRTRATADFWYFARTYFPPEAFPNGYYAPSVYHKRLVTEALKPGVYIDVGPRKHGKTTTMLTTFAWRMLTGRDLLCATYSETITKAQGLLQDIVDILTENDRITHDFETNIVTDNADAFEFRTLDGKLRTVRPFGEGRSLRGYVRRFARPSLVFGDDIETLQSSFESDQVQHRLDKLDEALQSMTDDGTFMIAANDVNERSAIHRLREQQKNGTLGRRYRLRVTMAWASGRGCWPSRYPATTERQYRELVGAKDDRAWETDFQANPQPVKGHIFTEEHLHWFEVLPRDVKCIGYVDPNLSLRAKGDTTGMVLIMYSPSTDRFYVRIRCRSYDTPGDLLNDFLQLTSVAGLRAVAMDGNVSQEAHWKNHMRAWSREHQRPYRPVHFKRYRTDELATQAQTIWTEDRIWLDAKQRETPEMFEALRQLFAFTDKKSKRKDDVPDALICGLQFIHELNMVKKPSTEDYTAHTVSDIY